MKLPRRMLGVVIAMVAVVIGLVIWRPELGSDIFSLTFVAQVLVVSIPYALAALGGALTESAGVVDLALEGKLLFGAFTAAVVGAWTGSAYVGMLGGIAAGVVVSALQMLCALKLRADQVIIGIAINLVALSGTRFLLQLIYGESANSRATPGFENAIIANPLLWLAVVAAVVVPLVLARTPWGLRLRAAGDRPGSLVAVGVSPSTIRFTAGLVGGGLAGAGGAQLSLSLGGFVADMSGGRGYMAVAMVILAGWRPAWAALACVGVIAADTINIRLQLTGASIPRELSPLLPYVLTLVVLVIAGGMPPPRSLGKLDE